MKKTIIALSLTTSSLTFAATTDFDLTKVYVGGGLGHTTYSYSRDVSGVSYQVFAGYELDDIVNLTKLGRFGEKLDLAVEVGYLAASLDYGINNSGVWSTAVAGYQISNDFKALVRLGYNIGDYNGHMIGVGAEYKINDNFDVRADVVTRPSTNSLQLNAKYNF
jgi:hypothetical protein